MISLKAAAYLITPYVHRRVHWRSERDKLLTHTHTHTHTHPHTHTHTHTHTRPHTHTHPVANKTLPLTLVLSMKQLLLRRVEDMGGGLPTHHEALLEVRVRLVSAGGGGIHNHGIYKRVGSQINESMNQ